MAAFGELAVGEVIGPRYDRSRSARPAPGVRRAAVRRAAVHSRTHHAAGIEANPRPRGEYRDDLATDIGVGGVARALGVSVLTRNVTDFERFDAVDIESY